MGGLGGASRPHTAKGFRRAPRLRQGVSERVGLGRPFAVTDVVTPTPARDRRQTLGLLSLQYTWNVILPGGG
jgi:hypothetical protein